MKILALIQARMGSSRLPGKVLLPILGKPMIEWQLERLRLSQKITDILLLTSNSTTDQPLVDYCQRKHISVFCGSENHVLSRFYDASLQYLSDAEKENAILIRLTGDCPLIDPQMIDQALGQFFQQKQLGCRYFGYDPQLPDGLDFEIFTWGALKESFECAQDPFEHEHVTPFMWKNPERFGVARFSQEGIAPGLRFSVDYAEDLELVEEIFKVQENTKKFLGIREINALLLEREDLRERNSKIIKNEGLIQSALASDRFQTTLGDQKFAKYGVALPKGVPPSVDLLEWATRMGVRAWLTQEPGRSQILSYFEKYLEKLRPHASSDQSQSKLGLWIETAPPAGWIIFRPSAQTWEQKLTELASRFEGSGIFIETSTRTTLAKCLIHLCHTRFL